MLRHVAPLWGAEGIVLVMGLVQTVVVARVLGPQQFGVVALAMAVPTLLFAFFDPHAHEAVVHYVARFSQDDDSDRVAAVPRLAYLSDAVLAVVGVAVVVAAAPWAADHVLKVGAASHLLVVYAAGLAASAPTSTSRALLLSFDRFAVVAKVASLGTVARTLLVLGLVGLGWGAEGVIYGSVAGLVLEGLVMGVAADRAIRTATGRTWRSARTHFLGAERRAMLSFMLYTELTSLVASLVKQADVVVLGAASGPAAAGYYRLAWAVVSPVTRLIVPLQQVLYPRAARLAAGGNDQALKALIRRQTARVGVPLALLVLAATPLLVLAIPRLAGDGYRGAAAPAALLLIGSAASLTFFWVKPCYLAAGFLRPLVVVSTVFAAATMAGMLVAAPLAGAAGVAGVRALITGAVGSGVAGAYLLWRFGAAAPVPPSQLLEPAVA